RELVVRYLRMAFSQDAIGLSKLVQDWQSSHNIEGFISISNLLEMYIRDLIVYRETQKPNLIANIDQIESIRKFVTSLGDARLEEMITHLDNFRPMMLQNVSPKLIFLVLALRFSNLMRGLNPVISEDEHWQHLPAFVE
ncbi:MAG: hypothetical protein WD597_10030, partial [Balneolaceae bacterium]